MGPSITFLKIFLFQKCKQRILKQQPPLIVPITGTPRMKWCEKVCRCPCTTPWIVPAGNLLKSVVISSVSLQVVAWRVYQLQKPNVRSALQQFPTWLTKTTASAPSFLNCQLALTTISAYCLNSQAGTMFLTNPLLVKGDSIVDSPITPIFMPDFSRYSHIFLCFGRNYGQSFQEARFAAKFQEPSLRFYRQGNRKLGPKSNQWLPIADPSAFTSFRKSFIIQPELIRGPDSIPP